MYEKKNVNEEYLSNTLSTKANQVFNALMDDAFRSKDSLKFKRRFDNKTKFFNDEGLINCKNGDKVNITVDDYYMGLCTIFEFMEENIKLGYREMNGFNLPVTLKDIKNLQKEIEKNNSENSENRKQLKSFEKYQEITARIIASFGVVTYMSSRYRQFSKINNYPDIDVHMHLIDKTINSIKNLVGEQDFLKLNAIVLGDFRQDENVIIEMIKNESGLVLGSISDSDIFDIIENQIGVDNLKNNYKFFAGSVIHRKKIMEALFDPEDLDNNVIRKLNNEEDFIKLLEIDYRKYQYILKYINPVILCNLYKNGIVHDKDFFNSINKLTMIYYLDAEKVLELFRKFKFQSTELSEILWRYFYKGNITAKQFLEFYELKCIDIDRVVKFAFSENDCELNEKEKMNLKLLDIFNSNFLLNNENTKFSDNVNKFIENDLNNLYSENNRNLSHEILFSIQYDNTTDVSEKSRKVLAFVNKGLVNFEDINNFDIIIDEKHIIDSFKSTNNINLLNKAIELNLISQVTILDNFEEEELFNLVANGLSEKVLLDFYSKKEIIELYVAGKLTYDNLNGLNIALSSKDLNILCSDIEVMSDKFINLLKLADSMDYISDLYNKGILLYNDIYELVEQGVITKEQANIVNEQYDITSRIEKLKVRGIQGTELYSFDDYINVSDIIIDDSRYNNSSNGKPDNKLTYGKQAYKKFDNDLKCEFWKALNGENVPERIPIKNHKAFEDNDYSIMLFVDRKIAIFEGDGRTLILPIKVLLEQVDNKWSKDDIVGRAKSRRELANNDKFVRSIYHSKNWAKNICDRIHDLNDDFENKKFIKENKALLDLLRESYEINTNKANKSK